MTRDLSNIEIGHKEEYDAWPHARAQLANLRDMAMTDEELEIVAKLADEFDVEDRAWVEAGRVVRGVMNKGGKP